ncbi:MAG: nucleotidyltransferase family protein [Ardenticatenaceae bacterium]|nr:nucleotidyltransferase family protein [Ardenticatenaceae bacterium]
MGHESKASQASARHPPWPEQIPDEQWSIYRRAIDEAQARDVRFALGGAFAIATYTGHWRNTKDLDLYVLPRDRDAMIEAVTRAGLDDYYDELPYDRSWIYRAHRGEVIVDVIWAMANRRAQVDEVWITRGPEVQVRDELLRVVPPEEVIWAKLYVLQRDRCDWPDVLNLVYATGPTLDWSHLLDRLAEDTLLLTGVLSVFTWLGPDRARALPESIWDRLPSPGLRAGSAPEIVRRRVDLLDTRPWFVSMMKGAGSSSS